METPSFDPTRSSLRLDVGIDDKLDVREFSVDDGLNSLFTVDIEVLSQNAALDFEEMVGKPAAFNIELDQGAYPETPRRTWSGVISEAHLLRSESGGASTYHVTLSPNLWLLTRRNNCRVFQQLTDLDIVKQILQEWNIKPIDECGGSYKTRKYRVQYQETDFAFICRMLESSGISYYFRAAEGQSQLVLSDSPERGPERSTPLEHTDSPVTNTRYATRMRASRSITSGRIAVADHDHRLPNAPLVASSTASDQSTESQLENFIYKPGWFRFGNPDGPKDTPTADDRGRTRTDMGEAQRMADQLSAAAMARARRYMFDSNAVDLSPGTRLSVGQHAVAERAGQLLITRTTLTGSHDTEAHVSVQTAAASSPYKPEMSTPQPVSHGVEMATVVGPAGEEIHTDEFGRVRVQFHWDRYGKMDEMSSCWVPVNNPWAGGGLGAINIPRVGQEVMVGFLAGNPEEPMIMGRMYTNLLRPPFPLPAKKNINGFKSLSTPGGGNDNEYSFDDSAGSERIYTHAAKNKDTVVDNDRTMKVGNDQTARVDRHRAASIGGNDKEQVEGNQTRSVDGNQQQSVLGDKVGSVLGNLLSMAGGERIMQTIGNMVSSALSHSIESMTNTTIKVGASSITITPESIVINSPKILLNPGDSAAQNAGMTSA